MTKIALISDIHFGEHSRTQEFSVPGQQMQDENAGAISLKNSLIRILKDNDVSHLFIAGDLTSKGSPHEFYYCQKELISIAEKIGIEKNDMIFSLGNHDIDWKISKLYEEYNGLSGTDFPLEIVKDQYQLMAASAPIHNMQEMKQPNCDAGPAPHSGIISNEEFIVFILNSGWCCTHNQEYSHGKLSSDQLLWFRESSMKYIDDKRWKIVLVHHHPFNYTFPVLDHDISTLEEGSHLLEIAGENGINLVIHGHRHHPKAKTVFETGWVAPITFICAGSCSVNSKFRNYGLIPNTIHIVELSTTPGELVLKNFQYSPTDGWISLKSNCTESPLDSIMYLGKLFDKNEINEAIEHLATNESLKWHELDDPLKYISVVELNNLINIKYSKTHSINGMFPNNVCILGR